MNPQLRMGPDGTVANLSKRRAQLGTSFPWVVVVAGLHHWETQCLPWSTVATWTLLVPLSRTEVATP